MIERLTKRIPLGKQRLLATGLVVVLIFVLVTLLAPLACTLRSCQLHGGGAARLPLGKPPHGGG
jgi:hypothetical protein